MDDVFSLIDIDLRRSSVSVLNFTSTCSEEQKSKTPQNTLSFCEIAGSCDEYKCMDHLFSSPTLLIDE